MDWFVTLRTAVTAADLRRYDESRRTWLPNDLPPVAPERGDDPPVIANPRLAETLARLAE